MKLLFIGLFLFACVPEAQTVIASNPPGINIVLKEKYGDCIRDTGTVVWRNAGTFIVTHRDGPASYYPECNFAIIKMEAVK